MSKSRVDVLEFNLGGRAGSPRRINEHPKHVITRTLAQAILLQGKAIPCGKNMIRLITRECFASIKLSARQRLNIPVLVPQPGFEDGAGYGWGHWPTLKDFQSNILLK